MKRVLSLVLALVLVLGMIPTFAAEMTGADHLYEHEFIAGDGTGNLMTEQLLTREQLAKLVLELNGTKEEAEVLTLPPSYSDAAKISAWARPYVAYAQIEGLMKGYTDNTFRPQVGVSGQQLAQVLTRALGYEFPWATVVADAADLGIEVATGAALTRGDAFEAMWATVNLPMKGETLPLGVKLGKLEDPTPKPVAFAVSSVVADNLKSTVVTFSKAVDEDTIVAANVKVFYGTSTTAASVDTTTPSEPATGKVGYVLSADGKELTIIHGTKIAQSSNVKVTIDGVKSEDGKESVTKYEFTQLVNDTKVPVIESVEYVNAKKLIVHFSEPANVVKKTVFTSLTQANVGFSFTINGSTAFAKVTPDYAGNSVIVELFTALAAGEKTIVVGGMKDFADFSAASLSAPIVVVADTQAPTATMEYVNKSTIKLTFNEDVSSNGVAYGSPTFEAYEIGNATNLVTGGTIAYSATDAKVVTITLGTAMKPAALTSFTLKYKNVEDVVGNKTATFTELAGVATDDTTKPEIASSTMLANNKLELVFSEKVDLTNATFKLYTETGTTPVATYTVANTAAAASAKTNAYDLTMAYLVGKDAANYKVKVEKVVDMSIRGNEMVATDLVITAKDTKAPTLLNAVISQIGTTNDANVVLVFSEVMDSASLTNLANYFVGNGTAGVSLANITNATATVNADGTRVTVKVPGGWAAATGLWGAQIDKIAAPALKDAAGTPITGAIANIGTPQAIATSFGTFTQANVTIEATGVNTIVVKANAGYKFASADAANFKFYANATGDVVAPTTAQLIELGVTAAQVAVDGSSVTLTTSVPVKTDLTYTGLATDGTTTITNGKVWMYVVAGETKNVNDIALSIASATAVAPTDKVAPTAAVAYDSATGVATVTFSELVKKSAFLAGTDAATTNAALAQAFVVKNAAGTRLTPGTDYTVVAYAADGTTTKDLAAVTAEVKLVKITIIKPGFNELISEISLTNEYLVDGSANANKVPAISSNSGTTVITEKVVPTVTTKIAAAATLTANATHTLVFSEALSSASQTAVKAIVDGAYTANGTATVSSVWNAAGTTLTVTVTAGANPNDVVFAALTVPGGFTVTDAVGNASAALNAAALQN